MRRAVTGQPVIDVVNGLDGVYPAPGSMTSRLPSTMRVLKRGIGAVAGPWTTAPSASRKVESCQGQTTQP